MATYTIDPGRWNDLLGMNGKARPGDTIRLLKGVYGGQVFHWWQGGAEGKPVVVEAAEPGVKFDGEHQYPDGEAGNVGPTGLEVVARPLIHLHASHCILNMAGMEVIRSRGHAIQAAPPKGVDRLKSIHIYDATLSDLRMAGIRFDDTDDCKAINCHVTNAGNYYPQFRASEDGGWPMTINCVNCTGVEFARCSVTDTHGEGFGASRASKGVKIHHCLTHRLMGVHYYLHGASDVECYNNLALETGRYLRSGSPPALFIVNPGEKQYEGKQPLGAAHVRVYNCIGIGGFNNFGVWGAGDAILSDLLFAHNTSINAKPGAKRSGHGALTVRGDRVKQLTWLANLFHQADTLYGTVDKASDTQFVRNAWSTKPPPLWDSVDDMTDAALADANVKPAMLVEEGWNLDAYRPADALAVGQSFDWLTTDFFDAPRRVWSAGAIEHPSATPPPDELTEAILEIVLQLRVDPERLQDVRQALLGASVLVR